MTKPEGESEPRLDQPQYVVARIKEALAHDERIAAQDVNVRIVGNDVFLTGPAATGVRRRAVAQLVETFLPEHSIHNQMTVLTTDPPAGAEEVT